MLPHSHISFKRYLFSSRPKDPLPNRGKAILHCFLLAQKTPTFREKEPFLAQKSCPHVEEVYENSSGSRKEIINLWRAGFGGSSSRRYVVHDVFRLGASYRNPEAVSKFLARLSSGTFLISIHGCHLHCVHVCRFANSTCRCYITKHLRGRFGRWMARRYSQEREFSESR